MFERRPMLGLLIGLTVCVSIWRISMQEPSMLADELNYSNQIQSIQVIHQQTSQSIISPSISSSSSSFDTAAGIGGGGGYNLKNGYHIGNVTVNGLNGNPDSLNSNNINNNNLTNNNINTNNNNNSLDNNYPSIQMVNYNELPKDDFNNLIDLHNFEFTINQLPCQNSIETIKNNLNTNDFLTSYYTNLKSPKLNEKNLPFLLILIHSAPYNYKKRLLIRETWGSMNDPRIRLIFLLGNVNSTEQQHYLESENDIFSDIVQGNFIDAYRNMTYKHVMALKWFIYYCPNVDYILKIDDDIFVNTSYLLKYLKKLQYHRDLLFCQKVYWSRVKRSYRSKWRVSKKEYPGRYYPTYCPGYSIIYSPDIAFRLYKYAQKSKYFWIDDVHITGTLATLANINITSFTKYILTVDDYKSIVNDKTDINNFEFLFTWPSIEEYQTRILWKLIDNNDNDDGLR